MQSNRKENYTLPKGVQPLTADNVGWNIPSDPRHSPKFAYLARIVCSVRDVYYVRSHSGQWEEVKTKPNTIARVFQEHGGAQLIGGTQQVIDLDTIKAFLSTGIQSYRALTYAPGAPEFVTFNGERRLNVWTDLRIDGDADDIEATEEFLKIIRNSLCGADDELPLPEMLDEIMSDRQTPFRWVMHWLACRYQRPGYTPQTNLWFCGRRGTGKGSLMSVMRAILGPKSVSKIDKADIARGWSDSMFGADLIEWDEFKGAGWHDFSNLIKEKTGNESYLVTSRNVGSVLQPAVGFHIFTTNERLPIFVEQDDRQNSFIATTENLAWSARAKALWDENNELDPRIIPGFAALLNAIEIDLAFIRSPIITALRTKLADHFTDTTIPDWIDTYVNDHPISFPKWAELHESYGEFVRKHCSTRPLDLKAFRAAMEDGGFAKEVVRKEFVGNHPERKSVRYVRLTQRGDDQPEAEIVSLLKAG